MSKQDENRITIRPARTEDLPVLVDIYNYEIEHTDVTFDKNKKTVEERQEWFDAHNVGNHPLIVAEVDGCVAGYASLSPYRLLEAYAETVELSVYVARSFRGKGVGKALMEAILRDAGMRDDIHCIVSVITSTNEVSIRMHEQFGFEFSGRIREVGQKFGKRLDIVNYQLLV